MTNIKPIHVMCEPGVEDWQLDAAISAIREVVSYTDTAGRLTIINRGVWRCDDWGSADELTPYRSVDWYIAQGHEYSNRQGQLNAAAIIAGYLEEPEQELNPHYDVIIVKSDIYSGNDDDNFVIGFALSEHATVVSLDKFLHLEQHIQEACIKTEVMHELGHVFGLVPEDRTDDVEDDFGLHCTNLCVMRQGRRVPVDWITMTNERLQFRPFCEQCWFSLRQFFRE